VRRSQVDAVIVQEVSGMETSHESLRDFVIAARRSRSAAVALASKMRALFVAALSSYANAFGAVEIAAFRAAADHLVACQNDASLAVTIAASVDAMLEELEDSVAKVCSEHVPEPAAMRELLCLLDRLAATIERSRSVGRSGRG
jgi:hypothetical protein